MTAHAPLLQPSAANQWGNCSGSAIARAAVPQLENEQTRYGHACHWVGQSCLQAFKGEAQGSVMASGYIGHTAPNGVVIDAEMAEGVQVYVDEIVETCQRLGALQSLLVEHPVAAPMIHPENWGTLDAAIVLMDRGVIYLFDGKFGHRNNLAFENLQLVNYMAGLAEEYRINGHIEQHTTIHLVIVQPFCYHGNGPVNEWTCKLSDLRPYWNQLHAAAAEVYGQPTMSSGPWCRDCPAVGTCGVARQAAYSLIDYARQPYLIDTMAGPELATERRLLERGLDAARGRLEAIEDELRHRIGRGEQTGYALAAKPGRLTWKGTPGEVRALCNMFGVDANKDAVITPTQAATKVAPDLKLQFKELLKTAAHRPAGGLKLVEAGDDPVASAFKRK